MGGVVGRLAGLWTSITTTALLLGVAHALTDAGCGFLIAYFVKSGELPRNVVWGLVQYNDNVYMDLSGPQAPINGLDRIQREGFGYTCGVDLFERMIWGSDGIDTELYLNMARDKLSQLTDPATVRRIFGGNIAHLLGLEDSS